MAHKFIVTVPFSTGNALETLCFSGDADDPACTKEATRHALTICEVGVTDEVLDRMWPAITGDRAGISPHEQYRVKLPAHRLPPGIHSTFATLILV